MALKKIEHIDTKKKTTKDTFIFQTRYTLPKKSDQKWNLVW